MQVSYETLWSEQVSVPLRYGPISFLMEYKLYLHHMGVSLIGGTPKTPQNDLF